MIVERGSWRGQVFPPAGNLISHSALIDDAEALGIHHALTGWSLVVVVKPSGTTARLSRHAVAGCPAIALNVPVGVT